MNVTTTCPTLAEAREYRRLREIELAAYVECRRSRLLAGLGRGRRLLDERDQEAFHRLATALADHTSAALYAFYTDHEKKGGSK